MTALQSACAGRLGLTSSPVQSGSRALKNIVREGEPGYSVIFLAKGEDLPRALTRNVVGRLAIANQRFANLR